MLSGYAPSAAAVEAVGAIGMDLQRKAEKNPGSFFWGELPSLSLSLFYVMASITMRSSGPRNGRPRPSLRQRRRRPRIQEGHPPRRPHPPQPIRSRVSHPSFLTPASPSNQSRVLSGIKITSLATLAEAITALHAIYNIPHVIITSVQIASLSDSPLPNTLTVIGSTTRSDGAPRLFRIDVPALDCYFSGTGDMFAALTVARFREAVFNADPTLRSTKSWVSPDDVPATELPLAQSTRKVLASMHCVLEKTLEARDAELRAIVPDEGEKLLSQEDQQKRAHLRESKAAEVRVVRHAQYLREPEVEFQASEWRREDLPAQFR